MVLPDTVELVTALVTVVLLGTVVLATVVLSGNAVLVTAVLLAPL